MTALAPRAGFDWNLVQWGAPDEVVADSCSYCGDPIGEDDAPLRMWNGEGWAAQFCDHCMAAWWGIQSFPEPADEDEP